MKILVSQRRAMGDAIMLTASLERLRNYFPGGEIYLLLPKLYGPLFARLEGVKEIWNYEDQSFLSLLFKIRRGQFDYVFDFHSSGKNIWLTRFSGAKIHAASDLHSPEIGKMYERYPNAIEWHKFFLERELGPLEQFHRHFLFTPKIILDPAEISRVKNTLLDSGFDPQKLVFLGVGASRQTKRWPAEYFAKFSELASDRHGNQFLLVQGPGDAEREFCAEILDHCRMRGIRPGKQLLHLTNLSILELGAYLANCSLYIGNDSGPKHLAAALGIRTLTFFGPEDPLEWHPYSREQHPIMFEPGLACRSEDGGRWCGVDPCVQEKHRCMRNLDALSAFKMAEKMMVAHA